MEEREFEIDLREYLYIIRKRIGLILLITIISAITSGVVSLYVLDPIYQASTTVMVGKPSNSLEGSQLQLQDINLNQRLAKTYSTIVQSRRVSEEVIKILGLPLTADQLRSKSSVSLVRDTEFITINATDTDPTHAALIANTVADTFMIHVKELMRTDNVQVLDKAIAPKNPIKPRANLNIAIATVLGFMVSIFLVFLLEYLDNTIKTPIDVEKHLGLNVIGTIPAFDAEQ